MIVNAQWIKQHKELVIYLTIILFIYVAWIIGVEASGKWEAVAQNWHISLTMALGSFIAGATAEGGGAVAFPIFTKMLHIPVQEAKTFGLMIQTVGMGMAGFVILLIRVPIFGRGILYISLGGTLGVSLGLTLIDLPSSYARILFTMICLCFGLALVISRWLYRLDTIDHTPVCSLHQRLILLTVGLGGGVLVSQIGTGIDMLSFIFLVLMFGINEKRCIPTTVIIMAINAAVGFMVQATQGQINTTEIDYWLAAVPIVVIGAPLGAYFAYKLNRDVLLFLLLFLIGLECVSTLWIIPFTPNQIMFSSAICITALATFIILLRYRVKKFWYQKY